MESRFDTSHSLFALTLGEKNPYSSHVRIPPEINCVIEGVIPQGQYGENLLRQEIILLESLDRTHLV